MRTTDNRFMPSYTIGLRGSKGLNDDEMGSVSSDDSSVSAESVSNPEYGAGLYATSTNKAQTQASVTSTKKKHSQTPQEVIDEFWAKFNSKAPGRGMWLK